MLGKFWYSGSLVSFSSTISLVMSKFVSFSKIRKLWRIVQTSIKFYRVVVFDLYLQFSQAVKALAVFDPYSILAERSIENNSL